MSDESKSVEDESKPSEQEIPYSSLVENIYSKLEFFFSSRMTALFEKADDFLFDAANKAGNIAQQNNLFEFMNALRAQKQAIEKGFVNELNYYLKPIAKSKELPKKKLHKQSEELGLIDQDEMDQMVALTTISSKAAMDMREELSHLDARLEHLGVLNTTIFHDKALDPKIVCEALHEALEFSDFSKDNKLILYKIFDQEVVRRLKELYKELNQLMIEEGILPQIQLSKIKRSESHEMPEEDEEEETQAPQGGRGPARRGGGGGGHAGAGSPQSGGTQGGGTQGGMAGGAGYVGGGSTGGGGAAGGPGGSGYAGGAGGGSAGGAQAGIAGGPGGAYAGGSGAGGAQGGTAAGGSSGPGGPAGEGKEGQDSTGSASGDQRMSSTGYSVGQIKESIRNFVGGLPSDADQAVSGEAGVGGGGGYYSQGDVVSALTSLQSRQAEAEIVHGRKLEFNADAVKKAVLSTIGEREGGVVSKRVNQVSEKTIDFIKLIFDAIIEEESITDTIKTLLLSLQIPVIKAAMIDADFFVDDKHPARQVLDKIAEAGVGVSDHKDPVYIELEKIVKKLLREFKEDLGAFATALKELIELTEGIYRKAREKEEFSQQEIKENHARSVVLQEIRKITIGKELPEGIRTLVLKVWPSIMYKHYLKNGKANDEWVEMLMILAKIIESVQPLTSIQEQEELGLTYADIVKATRDKLMQLGKSEKAVNKIVSDLQNTYEELMRIEGLPDEAANIESVSEEPEDVAEQQPKETEEDFARNIVASVIEGKNEPVKPAEAAEEVADEAVVAEAAIEEQVKAAEDSENIARSKIDNLPNEIQPGAWFIVYNGEDKPVRRLKLAVILMQDATLVFVDHLGNVVIEKDAEEFNTELEKGLSGIIMQHSVFDHALRSALGNITR